MQAPDNIFLQGNADQSIVSNQFYSNEMSMGGNTTNSSGGCEVDEAKWKFAQEIVNDYLMQEVGEIKYF